MTGIIYANTSAQGIAKLDEMQRNYEQLYPDADKNPRRRRKTAYEAPNGDYWVVALLNTSARGLRCNVAYVPFGVDANTFNVLVMPSITRNPFRAIHYY